jgi:DNA repair exonuclease SbcCD nuclease subunit
MIVKHGVNVILHLGDAYYAGTPEEYRQGIADPLSKLRLETKREIRFYSIPGNHDYYSWGLPFLCFVKSINE